MIELTANEIHIWISDSRNIEDDDEDVLTSYMDILDRGEKERFTFFADKKVRKDFLISRALVRTVLSKYVDIPPEDWKFLPDENGRPYILTGQEETRGITFNASQAGDLLLVAVTKDFELGIDVEKIGERRELDNDTQNFFSFEELLEIQRLPENERETLFFQYWTLKESYIKAKGSSVPAQNIKFSCSIEQGIDFHPDESLEDSPAKWRFWLFYPEPGYIAAVCGRRKEIKQNLVIRKVIPFVSEYVVSPEIIIESSPIVA